MLTLVGAIYRMRHGKQKPMGSVQLDENTPRQQESLADPGIL